eukprot:2229621-Rhodomonas_salina.1
MSGTVLCDVRVYAVRCAVLTPSRVVPQDSSAGVGQSVFSFGVSYAPLPAYACPMPCPTRAVGLRTCYVMSGTERAYAHTRRASMMATTFGVCSILLRGR